MTKEQKLALIEDLNKATYECIRRYYNPNGKDELECVFCLRDLDAVDSDYAQHTEPSAFRIQNERATKLRYTPIKVL